MLSALLALAAFAAVGIGILGLSQATSGVGAICIGVFLIACVRINQATGQHAEIMKFLAEQNNASAQRTNSPPPLPRRPLP